jgi:hypothetical protein
MFLPQPQETPEFAGPIVWGALYATWMKLTQHHETSLLNAESKILATNNSTYSAQ